MPYLHCPSCHRTAWVRVQTEAVVSCRTCGTDLHALAGSDVSFLADAVRERFARDARLNAGRPRFVRDTGRLAD